MKIHRKDKKTHHQMYQMYQRTNTAKTGNPKSNGNGTRSRTTKDSSAGRFANVKTSGTKDVGGMGKSKKQSKGLPKGGRKTKKKKAQRKN